MEFKFGFLPRKFNNPLTVRILASENGSSLQKVVLMDNKIYFSMSTTILLVCKIRFNKNRGLVGGRNLSIKIQFLFLVLYGPEKELVLIEAALTSFNSRFPATNCIDGQLNTHCHGNSAAGDTLTITLEETIDEVTRIKLDMREDCCQNRLAGAIVKAGGNVCEIIASDFDGPIVEVVCANSLNTNTITIETINSVLNLAQVTVYGRAEQLGKEIWGNQSHVGGGGSRTKNPVLNNFSPIYYWGPIFGVG
jgi:hypothetical protein